MSAAAIIIMRRKRLIRQFREAGAFDEQHAIACDALCRRRSWTYDAMLNDRVFLRTRDGRFYMDSDAAEAFMRKRRRRALIGSAVMLLVFFLVWLILTATR